MQRDKPENKVPEQETSPNLENTQKIFKATPERSDRTERKKRASFHPSRKASSPCTSSFKLYALFPSLAISLMPVKINKVRSARSSWYRNSKSNPTQPVCSFSFFLRPGKTAMSVPVCTPVFFLAVAMLFLISRTWIRPYCRYCRQDAINNRRLRHLYPHPWCSGLLSGWES